MLAGSTPTSTGATVNEDLVEATDQHQGLAVGIPSLEDQAATPAAWTQRPIVDREGACIDLKTKLSKMWI
jgi:hypothetical protein